MSWGKEITPNEPDWVGELIDEEISRRDAKIERLQEWYGDAMAFRESLREELQSWKAEARRQSMNNKYWRAEIERLRNQINQNRSLLVTMLAHETMPEELRRIVTESLGTNRPNPGDIYE